MRYTKKETKVEEKEKFDLQECFALWIHKSKNGNMYLSGYDFNKNKLVGFFNNKTQDKQPDIRINEVKENGETGEEIITLWETTSKAGNKMLTGLTNEKEKLIAFFGKENEEKRPYIRGYFRKD